MIKISKKIVCNRCVMDNVSDDTIKFDEQGNCNYCSGSLARMDQFYFPNEKGRQKLEEMIHLLKKEGVGKEYDCMMGVSGGLDSSYLAYLGSKWGLRILALHIDDGFDTQISKDNIEKLCKAANIKLITIKPNKEQFYDLTRAFIMAGVPNIAIPQDNVLLASLYKYAKEYKIKYFLSGANFALESILQRGNTHNASDKRHILHIHKLYGKGHINDLPLISLTSKYVINKYINKIEFLLPLDLIDYNRIRAIEELKAFCDFNYYGAKHSENTFTKFMQVYYLPKKFNVDKRTSHLSSLIVTNQMTRSEALEELKKPLYDEEEMKQDIALVLKQLDISHEEFERIMNQAPKKHTDYKVSKLNSFAGLARKFRKYLAN